MIKTFVIASAIALGSALASPLSAQSSSPAQRDSAAKGDIQLSPAADSTVREIQRAADELASAVQAAVVAAVNKPEVRIAALQVAAGAVAMAQLTLTQQIELIQSALAAAGKQIAAAQAQQQAQKK